MVLSVFRTVYDALGGYKVVIDNYVCRLHYKVTAVLLLVFSALLTCRQYFGDPIDCIVSDPKSPIESEALDTFCWIFSTFTVSKHQYGKIGQDIIFPGVGGSDPNESEIIQQKYYQWVTIVLFLQAVLFLLPHLIWLLLEDGRLEQVANDLDASITNSTWTKQRIHDIVDFVAVWKLNRQKGYAMKYAFCEFLNFVNVIGQLCALEHLFGGQFICYGQDMFNTLFSTDNDADDAVMARIFPKVAKCSFRFFGPSGSMQNVEALCILPLNIFNEKIFGFCFFWFVFVTFVTFFALLYRVSVFDARIRFQMLRYRFDKVMSATRVNLILSKFDFGDCFFLCQLSKNINPYFFDQLLDEIVKKLESLTPAVDDDDSYIMHQSDGGGDHYSKIEEDRPGKLRDFFKNGSYKVGKVDGKIPEPIAQAV